MNVRSLFPMALFLPLALEAFSDCEAYLAPPLDSVVVARGELEVLRGRGTRGNPIGGVFFTTQPHGIVDTISVDERFRVVDVFRHRRLLGSQYYLRIESPDDSEDICRRSYCWVFQGHRQSDLPPNIVPECWRKRGQGGSLSTTGGPQSKMVYWFSLLTTL